MRLFFFLTGLLLLMVSTLQAQPLGPGPAVIGKITIDSEDIFTGPEKDRFPYSWANILHIQTKESTILAELLFEEGDPFNAEIIIETERLLRQMPIFRYVTIETQPPVNGVVNIIIHTQDVWTTSIHMSYSAAGGKNFYRLGILEQNVLGYGIVAGAFIRQKIDRFVKGFSVQDPNFFGSGFDAFAGYGEDQKGREWEAHLDRTYDSRFQRHAEGVNVKVSDDESRLFENGDEVATFIQKERDVRAVVSYSVAPSLESTKRVGLIYERTEDEFFDFRTTRSRVAPQDRTISAVLLNFDYTRYNYIKERGLDTFDRDEDLNLGIQWLVEGGPSLKKLGATRNGTVGRGFIQKAWVLAENIFTVGHVGVEGRRERGTLRDTFLRFHNQILFKEWRPQNTVVVRTLYVAGKNLDAENQLLLGGENGLRGYSVRQFSGNKKFLFTVENRKLVLVDWLHLVNVGWAVFADAGGVWERNQNPSLGDIKADAGVGLRFSTTRSVDPSIIRVDLAYAFSDNDRSSRWLFNLGLDFRFNTQPNRKFDQ